MENSNKIRPQDTEYLQMSAKLADFPKSLWYIGTLPESRRPSVAIVGTRKITPYGKEVTYQLSYALAKQGIVVVSGLAIGTDAVAHQAALDAGGTTIAVLPTPLGSIHPRANYQLAQQIVASGGALLSEYGPDEGVFKSNFVARNRIVSGMSDGVLITEAAEHSGTTSTANFALDQGKAVMAVPGNITSPASAGCNNLLKTGATPVTSVEDVLFALGVASASPAKRRLPLTETPEESIIIAMLANGHRDGDALLAASSLEPAIFNSTLTMLEITGRVRALGANQWSL